MLLQSVDLNAYSLCPEMVTSGDMGYVSSNAIHCDRLARTESTNKWCLQYGAVLQYAAVIRYIAVFHYGTVLHFLLKGFSCSGMCKNHYYLS